VFLLDFIVLFPMLLDLHQIHRASHLPNFRQLALLLLQRRQLYPVVELFLHLLEERTSLFLHEFQSLFDGTFAGVTHAFNLLYLADHFYLLLFFGFLVVFSLIFDGPMVLFILLVEDFLAALLEFALPLAILIMQFLDIFLHLDSFSVVLRPIMVLPLEQTQR
jgi:hypothetical protein